MNRQLQTLTETLTQLAAGGGLCVAFSGGVDSSLLVKLACGAGIPVHAVTFDSTLQPAADAPQAAKQAASYGVKHVLLRCDPLSDEVVRMNRKERCYRCKYALFARLREYAAEQGFAAVIDGTNADDLSEYRPGLRALRELSIVSPLAELGITKAMVREFAAEIGLDVAKKPSSPCLATRFPYDTLLTEQELSRAGKAEELLRGFGFLTVRARVHGELLRIEVPLEQLAQAVQCAGELVPAMRALGFSQVTLDLAGFRSGSFDGK